MGCAQTSDRAPIRLGEPVLHTSLGRLRSDVGTTRSVAEVRRTMTTDTTAITIYQPAARMTIDQSICKFSDSMVANFYKYMGHYWFCLPLPLPHKELQRPVEPLLLLMTCLR